jgi:hypothetical protein
LRSFSTPWHFEGEPEIDLHEALWLLLHPTRLHATVAGPLAKWAARFCVNLTRNPTLVDNRVELLMTSDGENPSESTRRAGLASCQKPNSQTVGLPATHGPHTESHLKTVGEPHGYHWQICPGGKPIDAASRLLALSPQLRFSSRPIEVPSDQNPKKTSTITTNVTSITIAAPTRANLPATASRPLVFSAPRGSSRAVRAAFDCNIH